MPSAASSAGGAPLPGPGRGPLRAACEVLGRRRAGAYHALTFVAPEMAERARPGQFVSLGVDVAGAILRRPFSIFSASRHGPWPGTIDIVFDVVGPGTRWLAAREKHDTIDVVGPLGTPFPIPQQPVPCLLVGGGYGAAPLLYLGERLVQEGFRVDMVMGAATEGRLFNVLEVKRVAATAAFTTEDGSLGRRGRVTDVLGDVLDQTGSGVVYACGPMPMLAAVARIARARRVPSQVAVEEAMACGVGVCMTCVVPYRTRDDGPRNLRACIDGPVFNGARVLWDEVGSLRPLHQPPPADLEELRP